MSDDAIALPPALAALRRRALRRVLLIDLAAVLPLALGLALLVHVFGGSQAASVLLLAAVLLLLAAALAARRRHDRGWLLRQLDAACPQFEDCTALALQASTPTQPLAALQQARIRARIAALPASALPDLRPPFPQRRLLMLAAAGGLLACIALLLPDLLARLSKARAVSPRAPVAATAEERPAAGTALRAAQLTITAPAYMAQPPRSVDTLDARLPAGSTVHWRLELDRSADAVSLSFHDGSRLALHGAGTRWQGSRVIETSTLYRLELRGAAALAGDRGYRLEALADQPPAVQVLAPEQTLTMIRAVQPEWPLAFEAQDDVGLGDAELSISHVQGAGDQLTLREQRLPLSGEGDARRRRYRQRLDLKALGYAQGDDLIVRLAVRDRRLPLAQTGYSPSLILRWPADDGSPGESLQGAVQKLAPAYFRSQRQIIIDTEALIAARPGLAPERLLKDADAIGVDQKILRLRYGEFLGEEFENGAPHDDGEDAAAAAPAGFGRETDLLHDYGHEHNESEAATLMDPATKQLLRAALNEMWQAELALRQARLDAALPFEYKALALIKQVQQAERIHLARSGVERPPFDATRRLGGKRDGLSDRSRPLDPRLDAATPVPALLQQLDGDGPADVAPLLAWLQQHPDTPGALDLLADADRLRRDPDCAECRRLLAARLWPLLPPPAAAVSSRRRPDAAGQAWLDGLSGGAR